MKPYDLIIKGGRVVTQNGVFEADVAVKAGRIAAVAPGLALGDAERVVQAQGLLVMPGLVDVHVHLRDPGQTAKEDFYSGTCAAASAGITTVVAQPNTNPPITDAASFAAARESGERQSVVDFGITAAATETNLAELESLVRAGAVSLDFALGGSSPALTVRNNGALVAILAEVKRLGTVATIFTADTEVADAAKDRLLEQGRRDPLAFADAFPAATELIGAGRVLAAAQATGARVHLRQVSCGETATLITAYRSVLEPGQLTAEVTPHHLYLTRAAIERLGNFAIAGPPLRSAQDNETLQEALRSGGIDIVATDHAPHQATEKEAAGSDVWACPPGFPGVETMLPSLLAAVARGELTLPEVAQVAAEVPARIFGLYPRKGVIAVGSDADIALVDDTVEHTVDPNQFFTKARYSPFAGDVLRGRVLRTLVRGVEVFEHGRGIVAAGGTGQFVTPENSPQPGD